MTARKEAEELACSHGRMHEREVGGNGNHLNDHESEEQEDQREPGLEEQHDNGDHLLLPPPTKGDDEGRAGEEDDRGDQSEEETGEGGVCEHFGGLLCYRL